MPEAEQKPSQSNAKESAPDAGSDNGAAVQRADEDPVGKVYDSRLIKRLGHYLKPYWWQAIVSSVSISLKSISDVAGPYLLMVGIDRYFPTDSGTSGSGLLSREGGPTALLLRHLPSDPIHGITRLALHLPVRADLGLSLRIRPDLPDAVDRPENHVRPAPRHLPPHAAHARRLLRYPRGRPPGHAHHLRRRRHQRHVHRRHPGHRR